MQKFEEKLKNVPRNTPLVSCSTNSGLNRDQSLSVQDKVLSSNNLEVGQSQQTERSLKPNVFVLSKNGNPLMPCSCAKATRMLKKGGAKVVKRSPFTIQLYFDCEETVQEINLGIDSGYENVGFSAVSEKAEVISGTLKIENNMSGRLIERSMYRRNRRSRLWYRKLRFMNRTSSKKKGWLPPSIERRFQTHINLINQIKKILPISKVIIEVGNFDIQKINNPDIEGTEYQQGNLFGYQNMRGYLLSREKGACQLCGKEFSRINPAHIHHIIPRSKGGTDKSSNLALLHTKCHKKLHEQKSFSLLKKNRQFKDATFMSIVRWKFKEVLSDIEITFGYKTFIKRNELNLEKSHSTDAFIIAKGSNQIRCMESSVIQKKKNNRSLQLNRKGFKPSVRKQRYQYQPKDLVWIDSKSFKVKGVHSYGSQIKVKDTFDRVLNFSTKKIENHLASKTLTWSMSNSSQS